jgi:hypothetical protein
MGQDRFAARLPVALLALAVMCGSVRATGPGLPLGGCPLAGCNIERTYSRLDVPNKATIKPQWQNRTSSVFLGASVFPGINGSVVVANVANLTFLDPATGTVRQTAATCRGYHSGASTGLSPMLFADGSVLVPCYSGEIMLLSNNGTVRWTAHTASEPWATNDFTEAPVGLSVHPVTGDVISLSGSGFLQL